MAKSHDLIVIGAGPGGYVAALRAAQLGLNVACIEKEKALGGTCLRVGCIPSKALLESSERFAEASHALGDHGIDVAGVTLNLDKMQQRRVKIIRGLSQGIQGLFRKNKITRYEGTGEIIAPGKVRVHGAGGQQELSATHLLIATGSSVAPLPGVELDGDRIGTSTEALQYQEVPKHLIVIGAGAIGLELGSVWKRLGAKVTVLEYLDRILAGMDGEIATTTLKVLEKQGLEFRLGSRVQRATIINDECQVEVEGQEPLRGDRVLLAVGRVPNTEGLGLESVGIATDKRGRIKTDSQFQTNVPGIYAIGDVIEGPMLAHKAEEEGVACVERLVTGYGHVNYEAIPNIVYTHPEVAAVGQTEEQLRDAGIEVRKGTFPFQANGRAHCLGEAVGSVKILAAKDTDRILGVHILGPHAGDLIAEAAVAMEYGASSEDLARACHAHPTLAETLKEAALAVDGRALHF